MTVTALHTEVTVVDAEQAFLGAAMAGAPAAAVELPTLTAEDFTDPRLARVLEALLSLHNKGVVLEPVLVLQELRNLGHVDTWGDAPGVGPFLYDLLSRACPGPSAPHARGVRPAPAGCTPLCPGHRRRGHRSDGHERSQAEGRR